MNKSLYFDGRQIKNYLIGFASLFAEIPYRDRDGNILIVPIHYGSPSDVISYLEKNVDNAATANRNRLKDISIPMFSFRMTGIEKNNEKRRAPHDTFTVDLRSLGYKTGYVAMRPAPYKMTMELVCWASSDYQAFEITEQIIPYFNSPQQVKIEPLPRCPVSTTEIFLDSVEIDTDPESQKYAALITMTFSLTGFILAQPKIWSTNMAFELSLLTDNIIDTTPDSFPAYPNKPSTDWTVGSEIRDLNVPRPSIIPADKVEKFKSLEAFINNTPELLVEYGETLNWYNILVDNGRIDAHGNVVDTNQLTVPYNEAEKTFYPESIMLIADKIDDVKYVYENSRIQQVMKSKTIEGNIRVLDDLYNDDTETISLYLKLLDNNLVTQGFNTTNISITNSDKMRIFGTSRINVDDALVRLKNYLAALENLKIYKQALTIKGIFTENKSVYAYKNNIPYDLLPSVVRENLDAGYLDDTQTELAAVFSLNSDGMLVITTTINTTISIMIETPTSTIFKDIVVDSSGKYVFDDIEIVIDKAFGMVLKPNGYKTSVYGIIIRDLEKEIFYTSLDFRIFGVTDDYSYGVVGDVSVPVEFDVDFFKVSKFNTLLDSKFTELDTYVVCILMYNMMQQGSMVTSDLLKIIKNKYKLDSTGVVGKAIELKHLIDISEKYVDITSTMTNDGLISTDEYKIGQQTVSNDLAQTVSFDKDGKPIYDANRDGIIDATDLELLHANVDNPEDYYYELVYGVWHKKFKITDMTEERTISIMNDLKALLFILEKETYDEIVGFIILNGKNLVTSDFNLYSNLPDSDKSREIKSLGFNLLELSDELLVFRMFINAVRNILITERDFIFYKIGDSINPTSKSLMYQIENLNIDRLVIGKYLHMYFDTFATDEERIEKSSLIKPYLKESLSYYMDYYTTEFDTLIGDISTSTLFKECISYSDVDYLQKAYPLIAEKINSKYNGV